MHLDLRHQVRSLMLNRWFLNTDVCCRPYMAPEIFMSGHKHDSTADYYSLGICCYQMLMGRRPYKPDNPNMKTIVRMATYSPPEDIANIDAARRYLIALQEKNAPSNEFNYRARLRGCSSEAADFVAKLLICNPRYRLGSQGIDVSQLHRLCFLAADWYGRN